jgi:hypothetical protein
MSLKRNSGYGARLTYFSASSAMVSNDLGAQAAYLFSPHVFLVGDIGRASFSA